MTLPSFHKHFFYIFLLKVSGKVNMQILDASGKVVEEKNYAATQSIVFDSSHLKAGVYFVQFENPSGISRIKLIKK